MDVPHQKSLAIWIQLVGSDAEEDQQVPSEGTDEEMEACDQCILIENHELG